ncbi:MAG TPA: CPBP family glutamic-type intramembrane protease, partial [Thermoanaerobaculia bacterium]|nr:CPBP family glutamic-type intramembrane protease [Thermoanaerobaculia bacterium]
VEEIPWMKGMAELPRWAVPLLAALAAVVEELFFRGVVLGLLLMRFGLAPALAIAISALLFLLGQLIQVRTAFQALVVGSGSVAIGLVGGLLVAATGSVVLAVVAHASFVVFFLARGERARNQFGGPAREVVAR